MTQEYNKKVLSIIIPAYNEENTIRLILEKIKSVKLDNDVMKEIIIVNDCSHDDTENEIIKFKEEHPELVINYVKHEYNKGKGAAIHTGIKSANGNYLVVQDVILNTIPGNLIYY